MTNSIFQGKQYRDLEDRAITAAHALHLKVPDLLRFGLLRLLHEIEETGGLALSLDGSPPAPSAKKAKPDILTPKTRRQIEAIDSAFDGGWLELHLQDFLETVIAEGWTAAGVKPFMPPTVNYSQFVRLTSLRETWIREDNPKPSPDPDKPEKGLTDAKPKRGRKKRPHPLFGDTPRKAA